MEQRMRRQRLRPAGLLFAAFSPALMAGSPCEPVLPEAGMTLAHETGQSRPLHGVDAEQTLQSSRFNLQSARDTDTLGLSYTHEYSIVDVAPSPASDIEPAGNGHLHHMALTLDVSHLMPDNTRLHLQPALAVSSNQLKHPDRIRDRGLQLNAWLSRHFDAGENARWRIGLCADHRFGDYRLYPTMAWQLDTKTWHLSLGLPDSEARLRLSPTLETALRLSPEGNRWRVHDETQGYSWFRHRAWQLTWSLDWRPVQRLGLAFSVHRLYDNRLDFRLDTGHDIRTRSDPPLQLELSLSWYFQGR